MNTIREIQNLNKRELENVVYVCLPLKQFISIYTAFPIAPRRLPGTQIIAVNSYDEESRV